MNKETSGILLKKELGLEKFTYAMINRSLVSPQKILFVWYDSMRPNMPITWQKLKQFPYTAMAYHGSDIYVGKVRKPMMTPLVPLEDFNGEIRGAVVITVDLTGNNWMKKKNFTKVIESKGKDNTIYEFVTIGDLADKGNVSNFTLDFRKDRNMIMGAENTTAKLVDLELDKKDNSITFSFLTEATLFKPGIDNKKLKRPPMDRYKAPKYKLELPNPSKKPNTEKLYEMNIKVLDFFDWLDVFEGNTITVKELKEILEVSNVQVFSSAPSFILQGFAYWLNQLDASIYPETRKPKVWNKFHGNGDGLLDKHLYGLLRQFKFFLNPMASMLNKKLKDNGYL